MLKIDSDKLWKLLKEDPRIQKKLAKYVKEEEAKRLEAEEIVNTQKKKIDDLKNEQFHLKKKQEELDDLETQKHGDISLLEVRKIFTQRRLKRLNRQLASIFRSKRKKKKWEDMKRRTQMELMELTIKQKDLYLDIEQIKRQKDDNLESMRDLKREIYHEEEALKREEQNLREWEEEKEKKTARFYQASYEEVSENFKPCQDLVVPDLEKKEKITKEEAKEKANPILIDQEYLLGSPEPMKVRRLSKDEQENLEEVA